MKRCSQSNNSTMNEDNEGASCSKIGSTNINNCHTKNADCNKKLKINTDEPEAQIGLINETTNPYDDNTDHDLVLKSLNENQENCISWDDIFMATALLMAKRSKDPVTQVGACIVNLDNIIVGTGYNGMPKGCKDDDFTWAKNKDSILDSKLTYVCHAEMNAVLNKSSIDLKDCIIYVSLFPCNECAKIIIQSGIKKVVYLSKRKSSKYEASEKMFKATGVLTKQHTRKQNITLKF
ncbi:deoxycytidylate deaminase-like isoform X2 [Rhopalosiphum maidis]|uniref:deoxycytidylate deaminase-like isoform X2 n=1 Tax=Rhopalosiphum maidis TaxID=43146 RepID=UPI000EFE9C86|nr:deoxycytidylate deaminase-like isoform X2 [Rhopalosiphum maidis]